MSEPRLPRGLAAALPALYFREPSSEGLDSLDDAGWRHLLKVSDPQRLTLPLYRFVSDRWPDWVRERLRTNYESNLGRMERVRDASREAAEKLSGEGIDFVFLKGLGYAEDYSDDPRLRIQYDVDVYCPPDNVQQLGEALRELGYDYLDELKSIRSDHLPPMIRKSAWRWNGDFFDPGIPVSIEPHYQLWAMDGIPAPGVDEFWRRREGCRFHPVDEFGYRCLHVLRHVLAGNVVLYHVYELGRFLEKRAGDEDFWREWRRYHPDELRRLEAVGARFAMEWFRCQALEEAELLDQPVERWFDEFCWTPVESLARPNKREVWLHLALTDDRTARHRVLREKLLPGRLPAQAEAVYVPEEGRTPVVRVEAGLKYAAHLAKRSCHHARTLTPELIQGAKWWWAAKGFGSDFLTFLGSTVFYNTGLFVFFLLYNLYLMDLGFDEDFLGRVAAAMTLGSIAGALPAGWLANRVGLRLTILLCFLLTAAVLAARSLVIGEAALVGTAFAGGAASALWMVLMAPAVARLTTEKNRPLGYSIFFSSGVGLGILGGLLGGRLPGWIEGSGLAAAGAPAKQVSLLIGCGLVALAAWPALRLRFPGGVVTEKKRYPRGPFVKRFLFVLAIWNLAVGSFNPFFNAYFSRQVGAGVEQIGTAFSIGQVAQVVAMLAAPMVYRRFGLVAGIMGMQILTGFSLGGLAAGGAAVAVYSLYMALQWMGEPGMYSLLMNNVAERERGGASALNFFVIASFQSVAALLAGGAIEAAGYPPVLVVAGLVAVGSGLLLRFLLGSTDNSSTMRS